MTTISPKKFDEYSSETKEDISKLGKHLRGLINKPYLFNRTLATICEKMYNEGVASALGGEVVEQGRCINVSKGTKWFVDCPHCGQTLEIDVDAMLPSDEGYGVKV